MPLVEVPGKGTVEFPDDMAEEDIFRFIKRDRLLDEQQALAKEPQPSTFALFEQEFSTPLVDVPDVQPAAPDASMARKILGGVAQGLEGALEGALTPLGISAIALSALPGVGKGIAPVMALGFGAEAINHGLGELGTAIKEGDPEAIARSATTTLIGTAMIGGGIKGARGQLAPKTEAAFNTTDPATKLPKQEAPLISEPLTDTGTTVRVAELPPPWQVRVEESEGNYKRMFYSTLEGKEIGYGVLAGDIINFVGVDPAFQRQGFGKAIVNDLRARGGSYGVTGTPEGAALMRASGAVEYKPSHFKFEETLKPVESAPAPSEIIAQGEAQMRAVGFGDPPPVENLPVVTSNLDPSAIVQRKPADYQLFNKANSGQFSFWFGKYGETAKQAWEKIALAEFTMREAVEKDISFVVEDTLLKLPTEVKTDGAKAFFEVLDGRKMSDITAAWAGRAEGPAVIEQAAKVRDWLDHTAQPLIVETKRGWLQDALAARPKADLEELYRINVGEIADTSLTRAQLAEGIARAEFPDNWGITDGSYLPHIFSGDWKVEARLGDRSRFVTRARSVQEAKLALRDFVRSNPDMAEAKFSISSESSIPADVVRMGDKQLFRLLNEMRERLEVDASEIKDATEGLLGRKASKQKWFGSLQQRLGAENYQKNFSDVLKAYISGLHRWRVLSQLNRDVSPLLEKTRAEGRPRAADELNLIIDHVWGKPAESTLLFDNFLKQLPGVRDYVRPLALDRWLRAVRQVGAGAFLLNPKYFVINRLQPLQGLLPLFGEGLVRRAKFLQHSAEGKALLAQNGVSLDVGTFGEVGVKGKLEKVRERLTGERSNQELAFLTAYLHGLETGLEPNAAATYGKLRGQLFTQFTPLAADTPPIMRGPVGATALQFGRFTVKNLELTAQMAKEGKISGLARMAASLGLLGGLSFYMTTGHVDQDNRLALKRKLEEDLGEDLTNFAYYGLPGLLGIDLSGSLALINEGRTDSIYEFIGRKATGPTGSFVLDRLADWLKAERTDTSFAEDTVDQLRKVPALRPLAELIALSNSNTDVRSPDGEVAYRRTLADTLKSFASFRTLSESETRLAVDGIIAVEKESRDLKNSLWVAYSSGQDTTALAASIQKFNTRWPEMQITDQDVTRYFKYRLTDAQKTEVQRRVGKRGRALLPIEQQ